MTTILEKGENISLTHLLPTLEELLVVAKWSFDNPQQDKEFDIDVSAFMLTAHNKVRSDEDMIFYNQPNSKNNAIISKNNFFKITLKQLPEAIDKVIFSLSIHEAHLRQQNFSHLQQITIELFDFADKQKLVSYPLTGVGSETLLILGQLYRYQHAWKFRAVGQGYNSGLGMLAQRLGLEVQEDNASCIAETAVQAEVEPVKIVSNPVESSVPETQSQAIHASSAIENKIKKPQHKPQQKQENPGGLSLNNLDIDIHNTDIMTTEECYQAILQWFNQKGITVTVNPAATDTTGFFDEIALLIGDNYTTLKPVLNAIKARQRDGYDRAFITLSKYDLQQQKIIKAFCKELYDKIFLARFFYSKKVENQIVLQLQTATKIVNFFNGEWLEWFAFIRIAEICSAKGWTFSCTRNMEIAFGNGDKYEVDVFFLINGIPLFIECKSGEFREFIDKYTKLKRRLAIEKPYFLFLLSGVEETQIKGFNATFDISFVNEKQLETYLDGIF